MKCENLNNIKWKKFTYFVQVVQIQQLSFNMRNFQGATLKVYTTWMYKNDEVFNKFILYFSEFYLSVTLTWI